MPDGAAVKVQLSVFRIIPVVDGNAVGIAAVAQDGEHAPLFPLQDANALLLRKRLLHACQRTEGRGGLLQLLSQNGVHRQIAAGICVVAAAAAQDAFLLHACLAHDLAGIGVIHIVLSDHLPEAHLPEQVFDHGAERFGGDALAPPGSADAVAQLRPGVFLVDAHHGDAADGLVQLLEHDGPLVVILPLGLYFP